MYHNPDFATLARLEANALMDGGALMPKGTGRCFIVDASSWP